MKLLQELIAIVESAKVDAERFYGKGNAAAGTRLRNKMQQAKSLATSIRKDVSEIKNSK